MALGAQPADLMRAVMRDTIVLVLIGFAAGLPAALACGQLVSSQLYGVPAHDPARLPRLPRRCFWWLLSRLSFRHGAQRCWIRLRRSARSNWRTRCAPA